MTAPHPPQVGMPPPQAPASHADAPPALRDALRAHSPLLMVVLAAALLRAAAQVAYQPALLYYDSFRYLFNTSLDPASPSPLGYIVLLVLPLARNLPLITFVQHLLGLAMGVAIYALLRRRGTSRWLATLAAVPVLLDGYQVQIEQHVMSDTLFQALILGGLMALTWHPRPTASAAAGAGLLLGLATTVRLVGQPLIIPAVMYLLLSGGPWRRRATAAAMAVTAFALPLLLYAGWYQLNHGEFRLNRMGAQVLYARTASLADCEQLVLPQHLRPLCPSPALQQRLPIDDYVWQPTSPARTYRPPPGIGWEEALRDFSRHVVTQQPGDVLAAILRDLLKGSAWQKTSAPRDVPVDRWHFPLEYPEYIVTYDARDASRPVTTRDLVVLLAGSEPSVHRGLAQLLRSYQLSIGFVPGTVLTVALLLGLAGAAGVGAAHRRAALRNASLLWSLSGGGLLLAASVFEFSWRYQLPGLVLLPVAAALAMTAMRPPPRAAGSAADDTDEAALTAFRARYPGVSMGPLVAVIAAYNEAENLGGVLAQMPAQACGLPLRTLVVVDGATDTTAQVASTGGAYVCDVGVNRGQGAALRLGYRIAREGGARYVVTLDADGQYDPAEIPVVVEPLVRGEADFVTGSRRLGREETDDRVRRVGVRLFAWLVTLLTGRRITDTSNGLRAMTTEVTAAVTLAQPQYQASELLIGALVQGFRVVERPTTMRQRSGGSSKKGGNLVYGVRYARVVLGTWWRERGRPARR